MAKRMPLTKNDLARASDRNGLNGGGECLLGSLDGPVMTSECLAPQSADTCLYIERIYVKWDDLRGTQKLRQGRTVKI